MSKARFTNPPQEGDTPPTQGAETQAPQEGDRPTEELMSIVEGALAGAAPPAGSDPWGDDTGTDPDSDGTDPDPDPENGEAYEYDAAQYGEGGPLHDPNGAWTHRDEGGASDDDTDNSSSGDAGGDGGGGAQILGVLGGSST